MNYTTILEKGKSVLLWIYKNIIGKFTNIIDKVKERFPIINEYPVLKYSLIPVIIGLFMLFRNVMKFIINEVAAWTSSFVAETFDYSIPQGTIVFSIAAVFISSRIAYKIWGKKSDELALE